MLNAYMFRLSWKVSRMNDTCSFCTSWFESRRISLATSRPGWLSQQRNATYRFSWSKSTHISVFSVSTAPTVGSTWMKFETASVAR